MLISGGSVCDGTGGAPFPADVRIECDRIAEVAPGLAPRPGERQVSAGGKIVAPGFIDLHSHADLILTLPPGRRNALLAGRLAQGITTEIVGNCGLGPAPCPPGRSAALGAVLAWMTPEGGAAAWPSIGLYLDRLEAGGVPLNVGTLVAHGAVRLGVMGLRPGAPDPGERKEMLRAVESALGEGAFGLSCGLIYPPGLFSDTDELIALAGPVARTGRLLTSHVRGSSELLLDAVDELLRIGRESGCRVHHSHSEAVGRAHWGGIERVLAREERARREGLRVSFDMFPYTVAATTMLAIYPPWALAGGVPALLDRLRDPALRERVRRDVEGLRPSWPPWREGGWPHNLVSAVGWGGVAVASVGGDADRRFEGMSLEELGRDRGRHPFDAISDLMLEAGGEVGQWVFEISGAGRDEEGLERLAADPAGAFCTDAVDTGRGLPHPAAYGALPRILGRFVRDRKILELGEAVRKMTSLPASLLGLRDRGRVAPGQWADLVVFDPAEVTDRATLSEPRQAPGGISRVLVNGKIAVDGGRFVGNSEGRVLKAG